MRNERFGLFLLVFSSLLCGFERCSHRESEDVPTILPTMPNKIQGAAVERTRGVECSVVQWIIEIRGEVLILKVIDLGKGHGFLPRVIFLKTLQHESQGSMARRKNDDKRHC